MAARTLNDITNLVSLEVNRKLSGAQKVAEALSNPFKVDEHDFHIVSSVGISLYPDDGHDATA